MKGSFTTRKGALYCIVMTCLCSLLATGCASKYGAQTTDVHYYPDCYQPIADLRSAEKSFNTTMVMGTTMGALLGAVIGASQTGKAEGALAGAAIGAGAGAGASYLVAKYNNERDDRVRLASYARDLNADVNSLNRVTAAGQVAYNCYSAKFRAALEDYKASASPAPNSIGVMQKSRAGLPRRPPFWAARSARPTSAKPNTGRC